AMFAASFPQRTSAVILYGALACGKCRDDCPWQWSDKEWNPYLEELHQRWGSQDYADEIIRWMAPSVADDEESRTWWGRLMRLSGSPGTAGAMARLYRDTDIRSILGSIQAPTLVAHRTHDPVEQIAGARWLADHIPGARFVELPGTDYPAWGDDAAALVGEIEEFLTGARHGPETDRVLATVLF